MTRETPREVVEIVAKAICAASGELWRVGNYQLATGPNFELEDQDADVHNNHWRYKAEIAIKAYDAAIRGTAP